MTKTALALILFAAACGDDSKPPATDAPRPPADAAADAAPQPDASDDIPAAELAPFSPVPAAPPADTTNAFADNAAAAALGQMLFFDKSYAGPIAVGDDAANHGLGAVGETGKVACASCHGVGSATLDDQRSLPNNVSLGTAYGTRNAHGLVNSAFYTWSNWGGRFDSQWSLPLAVAENPAIMKSTRLQIAHLLYAKYRAEYQLAFGVALDPALDPTAADASRFPPAGKPKGATDPDGPWEAMTAGDRDVVNRIFVNYGKALAAYTRTLISRDAPFDRYVAGDRGAISAAAKRGLRTFLAKCAGCHSGPLMTDNDFHAIGVPQTGPNVPATDLGRYQDVPPLLASPFNTAGIYNDDPAVNRVAGLAQADSQRAAFRTKGLRGVAASGPYMHAGQLATLADVVAFYNAGGGEVPAGATKDPRIVPLDLDAGAQADLVAFLETLTGQSVDAMRLADTSK